MDSWGLVETVETLFFLRGELKPTNKTGSARLADRRAGAPPTAQLESKKQILQIGAFKEK